MKYPIRATISVGRGSGALQTPSGARLMSTAYQEADPQEWKMTRAERTSPAGSICARITGYSPGRAQVLPRCSIRTPEAEHGVGLAATIATAKALETTMTALAVDRIAFLQRGWLQSQPRELTERDEYRVKHDAKSSGA
jgi:hypothetical protein